MPSFDVPEPSGFAEVLWLEPFPDLLSEGLPTQAPGPEAKYEALEAISLAFITAVQVLPPRQRAALILRDVLGYPTREVAGMLNSTEQSIASALKRARTTLRREHDSGHEPPPHPIHPPNSDSWLTSRVLTPAETCKVSSRC